ncbi:MAG: SDR family oxidoreductase [Bacteroidales bacterium]|nr:SDR family oxidoreductase [Bacteroidales bacterium]MDZ4205571.1 SDR family oxidoreductase [Bacteroidales bacterium]
MDIQLANRFFVVCGAGSGFGKAIALRLVSEGAHVLAIARGAESLRQLQSVVPDAIEALAGDLTDISFHEQIVHALNGRVPDGLVVNAGGPPAKSFIETHIRDWDEAYKNLVRWKIALVKQILPGMQQRSYGRILFIESMSVKQPVENLVLSNSLRLAVVGMAKTLSLEVGSQGITVNVMAPGYHDTPAMGRLFAKKSEQKGISLKEARLVFEKELLTGHMGDPSEFAMLAAWLLSSTSGYINGQTFSVDGGLIRFVFG